MFSEIEYSTQKIDDKKRNEDIILKTIEKIEKTGFQIGKGKTAKVLTLELNNQICMKAVHNKISYNNVKEEMGFNDEFLKQIFLSALNFPFFLNIPVKIL